VADKIKPEPPKPRLAVFNFRHGPEGLVYDPPPEPPIDRAADMFDLQNPPRLIVDQIPTWPGFIRSAWKGARRGYIADGYAPEIADELAYKYQCEIGKPRRERTIAPPRTWLPGPCPMPDHEARKLLTALWRRMLAARVPAAPKPPRNEAAKPPSRLAVLVEALRRAKSTNADPAVIERLARAVVIAKTATNATTATK